MKYLVPVLLVFFLGNTVLAFNNRSFKRLGNLYKTNPWKCLDVSKRKIKTDPENPVPYYFASAVYRDKSIKHGEIKTRYTMLSKSLSYAMKFEDLSEIDLQNKVNWEHYLLDLQLDVHDLTEDLNEAQLAELGVYLTSKHQKMVDNREDIVLIADSGQPAVVYPDSQTENDEQTNTPLPSNNSSVDYENYFGVASGNENISSFNKIQEQELLKKINEARKEQFLTGLKWDEDLCRAARYHANDMATQDYYFEDSYDRFGDELIRVTDAFTRNKQFYRKEAVITEVIASGAMNAQQTLERWLLFDETSDILLQDDGKKIGIGLCHDSLSAYGYYWVVVIANK